MTCRELLRIFLLNGWIEKKQLRSHKQMVHLLKNGKVTIPMHNGDIPKGTLHAILKQAELKL